MLLDQPQRLIRVEARQQDIRHALIGSSERHPDARAGEEREKLQKGAVLGDRDLLDEIPDAGEDLLMGAETPLRSGGGPAGVSDRADILRPGRTFEVRPAHAFDVLVTEPVLRSWSFGTDDSRERPRRKNLFETAQEVTVTDENVRIGVGEKGCDLRIGQTEIERHANRARDCQSKEQLNRDPIVFYQRRDATAAAKTLGCEAAREPVGRFGKLLPR